MRLSVEGITLGLDCCFDFVVCMFCDLFICVLIGCSLHYDCIVVIGVVCGLDVCLTLCLLFLIVFRWLFGLFGLRWLLAVLLISDVYCLNCLVG